MKVKYKLSWVYSERQLLSYPLLYTLALSMEYAQTNLKTMVFQDSTS